MSEVACPLCGYETMVFEPGDHVCPNCTKADVRRVERKLEGHGVETTSEGLVMIDPAKADEKADVFRMLGVIDS